MVWCDERREPDLFWALRGAGGGQFGVVATLVFETIQAPATTSSFHLTWPYDHAAAVIEAWQAWAPHAPDELDVELRLVAPSDPRRVPEVHLFGMMLDADAATTARRLADIVDAVGAEPAWVVHEQNPYLPAVRRLTDVGAEQPPGAGSRSLRFARSEFFRRPLPTATVAALVEQLAADRTPGYVRELNFCPWGGAYNRVPVDASAFAHRQETFLVEHTALVGHTPGRVRSAAQDWVDDAWQTTHRWGTGGVYPNFPYPDVEQWESAYHGPNLTRLLEIKRRYDPDNWFRFHQSLDGRQTPTTPGSRPAR